MYSDSILDRLSILSFAKHAGFSLKEVQALLVDNHGNRPLPQRWRELAHHKIVELETFIAHANSVLEELKKTISPMCPRLAERGRALRSRNTASPVLQVRAAKRRR
jgi:DNA-binding transcriptional MerR regulator